MRIQKCGTSPLTARTSRPQNSKQRCSPLPSDHTLPSSIAHHHMPTATTSTILESCGNTTRKIKEQLTYAYELQCDEPDTRHWVHRWVIDHNDGELAKVPKEMEGTGLEATIPNYLLVTAKKNAQRPCMGVRKIIECVVDNNKKYWKKADHYAFRSYQEVHDDMQAAAKGLLALDGVHEKRLAKKPVVAALLAETSPEWQIAAQAAFAGGITVTTVYTTLGPEAMKHGIQQTEAEIIFLDWGLYEKLKDPVLSKCPSLRYIVFIGSDFVASVTTGGKDIPPFPSPAAATGMTVGAARCQTLHGLISSGRDSTIDVQAVAPGEKDVAIIMYTSGSTGLPKGVVLTHLNFLSACASFQCILQAGPDDIIAAVMPLAHVLGLIVEVVGLSGGAALGYSHPRSLTAASAYIKTDAAGEPLPEYTPDLNILRPTMMGLVPQAMESIAGALKRKGGLLGAILNGSIARKMQNTTGRWGLLDWFDNLVLHMAKSKLGLDRMRIIGSGGAPLSAETQHFMSAVFCPIAQGYGATETTGCSSVQECFSIDGRPADRSGGRVGSIQPATELKLKSVEEMGYLVTDSPPRGEVLLAGNTLSTGYYKMPEKTDEDFILHSDGKRYFHTGDIGVIDADGVLRIVDRKKDLVKLQGGEYVSLGKVESKLRQVPGVGACVVFARADRDRCVAIVSQPEKGWASAGGRPEESTLASTVEQQLRALGLARFEIPSKVAVDDAVWSVEAGLVTPSLKLQRNALREHYNKPGGLLETMGYSFPSQ